MSSAVFVPGLPHVPDVQVAGDGIAYDGFALPIRDAVRLVLAHAAPAHGGHGARLRLRGALRELARRVAALADVDGRPMPMGDPHLMAAWRTPAGETGIQAVQRVVGEWITHRAGLPSERGKLAWMLGNPALARLRERFGEHPPPPEQPVTALDALRGRHRAADAAGRPLCKWFIACGRPATGTRTHPDPAVGEVDVCERHVRPVERTEAP
ncbi:hypothetical protein [Saccharothrix sp. HUAS TT1]|uniref:hypothetical protein n=1 Tax=unclassified Saccharothrix TaxID=2593673 RepID=UPI00345BDD28